MHIEAWNERLLSQLDSEKYIELMKTNGVIPVGKKLED